MRTISTDGEFLRWKQRVDDELRKPAKGVVADRVRISNIELTAEHQADGSTVLYANRVGAPAGQRVAVVTIPG